MVAVVDFRGTAPRTHNDIRGLRPYLKQLIGEPFLFAHESYGGELTLHFGTEIESTPFRGRVTTEGTHILCLRASEWSFKSVPWGSYISSEEIIGTDFTPITLHDLETRSPITPGQRLTNIEVAAFHGTGWPGGIELGLQFSDESFVQIRARYDPEDPVHDLADWELFTPYNRYIKAGPGIQWEYSPSDSAVAK